MSTYRWKQKVYTEKNRDDGYLKVEEGKGIGGRRGYDMIKVGYF
jgi:hypothetical protein